MKFCSKCGTQMEDDNMFCPQCGATQQAAQPQTSDVMGNVAGKAKDVADGVVKKVGDVVSKFDKNGKVNKKFIPFILGGALVVVVVFLVFFFRSVVGSGSLTVNGAVKAYYESFSSKDAKDYMNATLSPSVRKAYMEAADVDDVDELEEELEEYLDYYDVKIRKLKIEDKDEVDKDDLEDIIDELEEESDVKVKISKMYEVEVEFETKDKTYYDDADWEDVSKTIYVYKSSGNWYVLPY